PTAAPGHALLDLAEPVLLEHHPRACAPPQFSALSRSRRVGGAGLAGLADGETALARNAFSPSTAGPVQGPMGCQARLGAGGDARFLVAGESSFRRAGDPRPATQSGAACQ